MKLYTITTFTKANRTEYFHAVTVEAENIKSAKEAAAEHIRATLDRHAFRMSNATAPASVEYAQWIADHFNVTVEDVMKAAAEPEGVDIYADEFKPAPVEAENPINSGNAPLYVWTFANGAESAATLAAEASSAADATEYARAARICANEAAEAAEIAGTAEASKDAERARIAADNAEAIRAYWDAHEEAKAAESAEAATSAAALDYDHITAAEHAAEAEKHADAAEKAAHEAAAIADEAHDRAAAALINAYAEAIGDTVTEDDPEAVAAHRVARACIGLTTATDDDRATVAAMVEAIAERTHAAEAIEDAREAWTGPDYYRIAYSDGGMDATNDGAIWYETAADLARDLRSAYESATDTHLPYAERIERPAYQRYELEAFLGDYADDYDADAIEAEATEYDPRTGRYEVRQVDAWMYDDSWTYNTTYPIGTFSTFAEDIPRAIRYYLKSQGVTFAPHATRTEYDGDVYEIVDRETGEPLFVAIPEEV